MKVALLYWAWEDENAFGGQFGSNSAIKQDEWHLPIDNQAILPIGTIIDDDVDGGPGIELRVIRHHFSTKDNLLRIQVIVGDGIEANPSEFSEHIKKNWISGNKINKWLELP